MTSHTLIRPLALALALALAACAAQPEPLDENRVAEQNLANDLTARGPYLRCYEEPDEAPGSTRPFGSFVDGDATFAILERRADAPCTYTLSTIGGVRGEPLVTSELPLPAGQYLHAEAQRVGARYLFVVSMLRAGFAPGPDGTFETHAPSGYEILALTQEIATGRWSAPMRVASHPTHAVWFLGLEAHSGATFTVTYGVDHYHELLFFSDIGRGSEEGIFAATFTFVGAAGELRLEPARRLGGYEVGAEVDGMTDLLPAP